MKVTAGGREKGREEGGRRREGREGEQRRLREGKETKDKGREGIGLIGCRFTLIK